MKRLIATTAVLFAAAIGISAYASLQGNSFAVRSTDVGALLLLDDSNTAIYGFDVVNYFTEATPTEGSDQFTTQYQGATWKFATATNQQAFEADPQHYIPAYGGYCAWGVAEKNDLFDGRRGIVVDRSAIQRWIAERSTTFTLRV